MYLSTNLSLIIWTDTARGQSINNYYENIYQVIKLYRIV